MEEVAGLFNIGRRQVYEAVRARQLRAARFGTALRIRRSDAEAWFDAQVEGGASDGAPSLFSAFAATSNNQGLYV
ncbi:helix-turn-helix domain-containing protein [Deinococcus phoenicis]|uniref:helix-turn-helix domain-containing protein n=1 Tax=Deinococcus phoenicis TaxID=1476583 RepID=UPI003899240F